MENTINEVRWDESNSTTWLTITMREGVHFSVSGASRHDFSLFNPTEDDLVRLMKGATEGLMKLHEYNVAKGE